MELKWNISAPKLLWSALAESKERNQRLVHHVGFKGTWKKRLLKLTFLD